MFSPSIDLGQVLIGVTIAILGFLVKWELGRITSKLDKHDDLIYALMAQVSELLGANRQAYRFNQTIHRRRGGELIHLEEDK